MEEYSPEELEIMHTSNPSVLIVPTSTDLYRFACLTEADYKFLIETAFACSNNPLRHAYTRFIGTVEQRMYGACFNNDDIHQINMLFEKEVENFRDQKAKYKDVTKSSNFPFQIKAISGQNVILTKPDLLGAQI